MNFAILSFIIGFILQFEALFLLLPWIVGMIYGEYHVALIYLGENFWNAGKTKEIKARVLHL